jgi:intracellular multiplication protein IcmL
MAEEEIYAVIHDDFYRDSFGKVVMLLFAILVAIGLLVLTSAYLHFNKPKPVTFPVDEEWRVQPAVPLDPPSHSPPDPFPWVSDAIRQSFIFDFYQYNEQLKLASQYFTPEGWRIFLNQLNIYVNYNDVQAYKMFVSATPDGAPFILQQGLLSGRYAWWVQLPIVINYQGMRPLVPRSLTLQILVVRVSTLNNLTGVGIENVIVSKGAINPQTGTG